MDMFRSRDNIHRPVSESALLNRHVLINDTKPSFDSQNRILFPPSGKHLPTILSCWPTLRAKGSWETASPEGTGPGEPRGKPPREDSNPTEVPARRTGPGEGAPGSPSPALRPGRPAPRSPRNRSPPARPRSPSPALAAGREPRPPVCGRVETGGRRQLQVRRNQLGKQGRPLARRG